MAFADIDWVLPIRENGQNFNVVLTFSYYWGIPYVDSTSEKSRESKICDVSWAYEDPEPIGVYYRPKP